MLVVVGVFSLIMAAVMQTWMFTTRSFVAMGNYCDLDQKSRNTMDNMTRDLRQSKVVSYYSTNILTCSNIDGTTFTYGWDPVSQHVYKSQGGQTNVLLTGCTYLSYGIFIRNPTNLFWFPYSAINQSSLTKLVQVDWRCSRRILNQYNTESVQTAKIVLRN
jgi:hypothetical protein